MKTQINKIWDLRTAVQFHRRHLEIAFQCFEEVQKKPEGFF